MMLAEVDNPLTRLLENDVLDERGFLDMRKIGELEAVFETAFGKTSMRTNITSLSQ